MGNNEDKSVCGVIMPISSIDSCSESHWSDVLNILNEAIDEAGFEGNLVSNADDVGIIHKRIIQNLYDNPIVVCDVSCKNPNVMFELGLRLAFDKPTIIIKDDKTSYTFDTSAIEHLEYPRDLRFTQIVEFKKLLAAKIVATYSKSTQDANYTTFLKHFGEFKVAKIDKKEVSGQEYIIDELKNMRRSINRMENRNDPRRFKERSMSRFNSDIDICLGHEGKPDIDEKMGLLIDHPALRNVGVMELDSDHYHLTAEVKDDYPKEKVEEEIERLIGRPSKLDRLHKRKLKEKNG